MISSLNWGISVVFLVWRNPMSYILHKHNLTRSCLTVLSKSSGYLRAMGHELSDPFITSTLELKLDTNTMFEWQKYIQDSVDVPHYRKLLEFIHLRAQGSEAPSQTTKGSFTASTMDSTSQNCVICKSHKHPLYACPQFKLQPHEKFSILRSHHLCMNCLRPGHFMKECTSLP